MNFNFQDFPGPTWFPRTFQGLEILEKNPRTFQDAWEPWQTSNFWSVWFLKQYLNQFSFFCTPLVLPNHLRLIRLYYNAYEQQTAENIIKYWNCFFLSNIFQSKLVIKFWKCSHTKCFNSHQPNGFIINHSASHLKWKVKFFKNSHVCWDIWYILAALRRQV